MKRAKLERRYAAALEELERLRSLRLSIWTDDGEIYAQTLGELLDEQDRGAIGIGEALSGVAARSPNVFLGTWRIV